MARGSERRSLLDGEIPRRDVTIRDAFDKFLAKLVDAFDFQIQDRAADAALETHERRCRVQRAQSDIVTAREMDAFTHVPIRTPDVIVSPRAGVPAEPPSALFLRTLSEKLTAFVLNESLERAAREKNPMELGWSRSTAKVTRRSSWLDDLKDLRDRATLSSERDLAEMNGAGGNGDDDTDVYFQTDDESSGYGAYQIMA